MKFVKNILFSLALISLGATAIAFGQKGEQLPPIKSKEIVLKNGLRVVLHEDHSTPVVAVGLWYHVGSKNEVAGRTGFAHLFEHMMFEGSKNYGNNFSKPVSDAGGFVNGTTDKDRTWYFEIVPSNFLERALYLEADRMGGLLDAISQQKLDNQRDVVKNERRERIDNQPYGTSVEKIAENMFPAEHPYHWLPIGSMEDLSAASLDDVKSFFRQYYVPNNAILVISGDLNENQTRQWVEKYFGSIAKGAEIKRPNPAQPKLTGEIRKTYEDAVPLPRLSMVWQGVPVFNEDEPALDILSNILTNGRGSRLQSNLVYGKELAQGVSSGDSTYEIGGLFQIAATAKPGKSLDDIEKEINTEIERIKTEPPTSQEVSRAFNNWEAFSIYNLETVLGKASQIGSYTGYAGKADYFQTSLDNYRKVTPADVQRVAVKYLTANRLVMSYVPRSSKSDAPKINPTVNRPTSTAEKTTDDELFAKQEANLPKPAPNPNFSLPAIEKTKLSNGLNVWIVKRKKLPIVSMNMVLNAGATLDPADKAGVASVTSQMLNQGTNSRTAIEIDNGFQSIGAFFSVGASWDSSNIAMQTLTKNFDQALDLYADIITNPSFKNEEFENNRRRALVGLVQRRSNPTLISNMVYNKVLYGNQPYGRQISGDEKSVKALTRDDLVKFYESYYRPNNATLIVVGDVDNETLMPRLEKAFAGWKPNNSASTATTGADETMMAKPGIYLIDKPGAAQSSVSIGQVGVSRSNPDYFAVRIMNSILGGGSAGRLFKNLRQSKGYTYGAGSSFDFRRGAGPFSATADVQTAVTKESIIEFMKELNGMRGSIPVTEQELENSKQAMIRRFPAGFETVGQISGQLSNFVTYELPDTYFNNYISNINAVSLADINRAANKYLTPDKMAIVIVGDKNAIEPKLKELGLPITILDTEGNPVTN